MTRRVTTSVRILRERRGWTQADLARRSGIPVQTISRWENDRVQSFDREVLDKLSHALGVEPGFLLIRVRSRNEPKS